MPHDYEYYITKELERQTAVDEKLNEEISELQIKLAKIETVTSRVEKIESNTSKIAWLVITAVILAVLKLVIETKGI